MKLLNWYKFIFTDNKFSVVDRIIFIGEHLLIIIVIYFVYKAIADFEKARFYLGLCFVFLIPLLANARKSYEKYTFPYEKKIITEHGMSDKQKEMLKVKQELLDQIENASDEL